jgi:hypothetical protein
MELNKLINNMSKGEWNYGFAYVQVPSVLDDAAFY